MTSNDVFLGGGSNSGSIVSAELPNIYGSFSINMNGTHGSNWGEVYWNLYSFSSFKKSGAFGSNQGNGTSSEEVYFNASLSNSIYKDNGKLIPKHYVIEFWIKFK